MSCGQNIDFKELSVGVHGGTTLSRGLIIEQSEGCAQGQMSQWAVDFIRKISEPGSGCDALLP
jgi:hypothetical protein